MIYFSFASKSSLLTHYIRRTVSYKIRKSVVYILSKMESESKVDTSSAHFVDNKQQKSCPRFMIQVLANGVGESSGIIVHTGKDSYLFNCGEGVQRCATAYGIKLVKTYAVFLTSHRWPNVGGIMGIALTLQTLGVKKFLIYGPPAIKEMIKGWESFVLLKSLTMRMITDNPKLHFDDGCLKIQFVPLYKSLQEEPAHKSNLLLNIEEDVESEYPRMKRSQSEAGTSSDKSDKYVQCYICKTPNFGQHLDIEACIQKGLEIGPMLKVLKTDKSVILNDGTVVNLDEVSSSTGEYKIFIVVECPSKNYLDSLFNEEAFTPYQGNGLKPADLVVHFTPEEVINEPLYQEWMSKFPQTTTHLILNSGNSCADLIPVHHVQTKLNYISEEIFPPLDSHDLPVVNEDYSGKMGKVTILNVFSCKDEKTEYKIAEKFEESNTEFSARKIFQSCPQIFHNINGVNVIRPLPTLSLHYHPKQDFDYRHSIAYDPLNCINEIKNLDGMAEDLKEFADFNRQWKASDEYKNLPEYPKVLFLGTGSSTPSRYRCTSAIVIYLNEDNLILLDSGEATYLQLLRLFGKEKMPEFMAKLKMIYVSHHHADHHMGMINILSMRQKLLAGRKNDTELKNLVLLVPSTISDWLEMCKNWHESIFNNTKIVKNSNIMREFGGLVKFFNEIGLSTLRVCRVEHCRNASGISLTDKNGFKITYSGDCRPTWSLIEIGKDSDLLIHEATFEDDLKDMARVKYHSTVSQAIEMGKAMNAKFTILTHFSQRYASIPQLPYDIPENVGIAFDNMRFSNEDAIICELCESFLRGVKPKLQVSAKTFPLLKKMFKFYKVVFADKIEKLNSKTLKRILRNEHHESERSTKIRITS